MISHTTPNGSVLVLTETKTGLQMGIASPVNRQGILEFLLQHQAPKVFVDKVLKFLEVEAEAAQDKILKAKAGGKNPPAVRKAPEKKG